MNDAYDDLKKEMDLVKTELPEDADDPVMLELNTSIKPNVIMQSAMERMMTFTIM